MDAFSASELSRRSGATAGRIEHLVDLGLLVPVAGTGERAFTDGDLQRIKLIDALEQSGISPEDVGRAVADGHVSLRFADVMLAEPVSLSGITYGELASNLGMDDAVLGSTMSALGLPRVDADDVVPDDDLAIANLWRATADLDPDAVTNAARVYGESLQRIADAENAFWESQIEQPMLDAGLAAQEIIDRGAATGLPLQAIAAELVRILHRRHLHRYATQTYVRRLEHAMEEAGVVPRKPARPEAIAFLDLSGFTRLTEEHGDRAAAGLARQLAAFVQATGGAHGGRLVKLLGDGAMLHFRDPGGALACALDLVESAPALGLPAARVGLHAGRVIRQDGDCFGRTVNVAARVLGRAGPGDVLVTDDVRTATDDGTVRFTSIGSVALKGLAEPFELYLAVRRTA